MTNPSDPTRRAAETGGDPSALTGSAQGAGYARSSERSGDSSPTTGDVLLTQHDQPAEGGVEEAEDGDGTTPGR